jgi:zinc protease
MNLNKYVPLALLALTLSAGSAFAQVKKKPVPSPKNKPGTQAIAAKSDVLPVDQSVIIGKLPNGLTYYIRANAEPQKRAELYLVNRAGSVLENDDQQGLAHFTEHMAFQWHARFSKKSNG